MRAEELNGTFAPTGGSRGLKPADARRLPAVLGFLAALLAATACNPSPTQINAIAASPPSAERLAAAVTKDVPILEDGRLRLMGPPEEANIQEIPHTQAVALARAWVRQFATLLGPVIEEGHGAPIDHQRVTPCGRPLYAGTAMMPEESTAPLPVLRQYGSWWLVTMCSQAGSPQLSVAVSSFATDTRLVDGRIEFAFNHGGEFFAVGIPRGHKGEFPAIPEAAVVEIAELTGTRVAQLPTLLAPKPRDGPPQSARWVLHLVDEVEVKRVVDGVTVRARTVYAAREHLRDGARPLVMAVARPDQPDHFMLNWSTPPEPLELKAAYEARRQSLTAPLMRRTDMPVEFDRVTVNREK